VSKRIIQDTMGTVIRMGPPSDVIEAEAKAKAEEAVTDEIAGRELVEAKPSLADDVGFGIVDKVTRKLTSLVLRRNGDLHPYAVERWAPDLAPAVQEASGISEIDPVVSGWAFAIADKTTKRVAFGVRPNGEVYPPSGGGSGTTETIFPSDDWAHWGDSLTAGAGGTPFPTTLATRTGKDHYNGGWGGQVTTQIAARQGGVPARVTLAGNTIPASGAVTVTSITRSPLTDGGSRLGFIAGVEGTLSLSGTTHTFTRSVAGDAVTIDESAYFTPWHGDTYRHRTVTIWTGRNDFLTVDRTQIVASIQQMIDYLSPQVRRVIVMEVLPWESETTGTANRTALDSLNDLLAATFAPYWLPIATWLRTDEAATAAGITFTADDETDMANGVTPRSLRADAGHLNTAGYTAVAHRVYQEAQQRGWL
jgi:hypothetical protein